MPSTSKASTSFARGGRKRAPAKPAQAEVPEKVAKTIEVVKETPPAKIAVTKAKALAKSKPLKKAGECFTKFHDLKILLIISLLF